MNAGVMMMISTWSGIRIWRPSIEVSSSAENCNLEKRNVREFIEKKRTKAGIKEKAKSPSSHPTTLTQLESKFAVGVAGVRSSAGRSK